MHLKRLLTILCLFTTLTKAQTPFIDVTQAAGINHQFRVFEGMFGGGACVLDFDNDGYEDVFLTGGMNDDILYHNNRNGTGRKTTFTNVYAKSGLTGTRNFVTQGVTAADVNRDGWVDLFITTITTKNKRQPRGGPSIPRAMNLLYLNNGNSRNGGPIFRDATREYGLDQLQSFSTGASFGDVNADGYPDLYVGNYFQEFRGELSVINDATVVGANQIAKGYLLINQKGKSFVDAYDDYGLTYKGFGFGGVFTDMDNDGDQDLIINHDFGYKRTPNLLLENQYSSKKFVDVAEARKMDLGINSMGTAVGDYNNDGWMDYYFTNIRFNQFMVNGGAGKPFANQTQQAGLMNFAISWGANFADFDHDGDLDLFVANGDLNPNCVPMADFYFDNNSGHFTDNARAMGLNDYGIGRGSVVFDYDNDGDLDLLVVNQKPVLSYPTASVTHLYRNDAAHGNWLKVTLHGLEAEMHGIGSRIEVVAGGRHMIREIDGGASSHISQSSTIAHFGLGAATVVDSIIVTWTGGNRQVLTNQKINALLTITEVPKAHTSPWIWFLLGLATTGLIVLLLQKRARPIAQPRP
ncbi:VCBS repeat-containing protein [Fibrella sp. HMF5335]|uniref:VCBS repeat-containing protein n=2 Tax=Fibrella rubiginis TaxID=2817060 RepID=A0A939K7K9_9BACT|nr:VCBS repeat-containing protein [Fibrella rubiginis]